MTVEKRRQLNVVVSLYCRELAKVGVFWPEVSLKNIVVLHSVMLTKGMLLQFSNIVVICKYYYSIMLFIKNMLILTAEYVVAEF